MCPRWGQLYGLAALMLAALAAVEILASPGAARTALQCGLALGGFGAMALWARRSRVALDQQDWCECGAAKIVVRVIPSRRPALERVICHPRARRDGEHVDTLGIARAIAEPLGSPAVERQVQFEHVDPGFAEKT